MTIELNQDSYIVGMWFSSSPVTHNDWMSCIIRDPENPKCFKGWSRFRYVEDAKIFDSDDRKSWTYLQSGEDATEEAMIHSMQMAQNLIEEGYPDKDCIIVKGGMDKFFELAKDKPWMNIKQVKANEVKE